MNPKRLFSTTTRVLMQLRHDPRTIGLVLFVPTILMIILYYVFEDAQNVFEQFAPLALGIIPFTLMFIVSSVAMLRERTSGTLERLLTMPISKFELIAGYAFAFAFLALLQSSLASYVVTDILNVEIAGGLLKVVVVAILAGVTGMSFGLFFSAFATSEFQAVQFMPAFVLPQFLTCGLFVPRENMAQVLEWFSDIMPLSYVVNAMEEIRNHKEWTDILQKDILILLGFILLAIVLGTLTLRRK